MSEPVLRRACDRCHGQKLKCRRNPLAPGDDEDCIRCVRARAVCTRSHVRPRTTSRYRALSVPRQRDDPDNGQASAVADHGRQPEDALHFSAGLGRQSTARPPVAPGSRLNTTVDHPREAAGTGGSLPDHYGSEMAAYLDPMLNPHLDVVSREDWLNPAVPFPAAYGTSSWAPSTTSPLPTARGGDMPSTEIHSSERSSTTSSSFLSALHAIETLQKPRAQSDASPSPPRDLSALVGQLSDLNSRLHRHMLSVPPYTSWESGLLASSAMASSSSSPENPRDSEFALDQTFSLSQELAELLGQILPTPGAEDALSSRELDPPSELLVLTSYLYLVEIYDKILRHMHICAQAHKRVGAAGAAARRPLRLPTLSVGAFAIATSSLSTGVVLLLLMQAMLAPIRVAIDEMTRGQTPEMGDDADSSGRITRTTQEAIREKEQSMMDRFATVTQLALQPA
ncbi:hypothetical protein F5Y14DRAFT_182924 [Nemania sp. NC0429]|nr:hypothetical protein F5Y14DRAFT_182924 [Nemania sp. NC0429]